MGSVSRQVQTLQSGLVRFRKELVLVSAGMLAGVVAAASLGWIDPDTPATKVLAALIGPLLGTGLAILGSRALQESSDRRSTLRKMQSAILGIEQLLFAATLLDEELEKLAPTLIGNTEIGAIVLGRVSGLVVNIVNIARQPPEFDGLLETDDDRNNAHAVLSAFGTTTRLIVDDDDWRAPSDRARRFLRSWATDTGHRQRAQLIEVLTASSKYFTKRLPNL
jgi:hypothetical protein